MEPHSDLVGGLQRYFQQLRPLAKCDADDGRIVGQMLVDLVGDSPKGLSHAIRAFSYRTAMLRECSLRHIGAMLVRLLSTEARTDAQGTPAEDAAIMALDPSSVVTEKQATAIGSAIAACIPHPEPAEALQRVVKSHAALRAMQSDYIWFVPMLEVLTAKNSAHGRSFMKPLSSAVAAEVSSVVPVDVVSNAGGADEGSSFTSVVIARHFRRRPICLALVPPYALAIRYLLRNPLRCHPGQLFIALTLQTEG
jgi:hypothetical protein